MSEFTVSHLETDSEAVEVKELGEFIRKISVCDCKSDYNSPEGVLSYYLKAYIRSFHLSKN